MILKFIKELAAYEGMEDKVIAKGKDVRDTLFGQNPTAKALVLEVEGTPVGFAVYFHNYSTFLCRPGIYIEDIYVRPEDRNKGYGTAVFQHLCLEAKENNYGRVEWWCLDSNKPAIDFYTKSLGAEPMKDWTVFRLNKDRINEIAGRASKEEGKAGCEEVSSGENGFDGDTEGGGLEQPADKK